MSFSLRLTEAAVSCPSEWDHMVLAFPYSSSLSSPVSSLGRLINSELLVYLQTPLTIVRRPLFLHSPRMPNNYTELDAFSKWVCLKFRRMFWMKEARNLSHFCQLLVLDWHSFFFLLPTQTINTTRSSFTKSFKYLSVKWVCGHCKALQQQWPPMRIGGFW